ncbi:MAG: hypothetical protein WA851_18140, partial [Xanthobacteraceae bacterium]
MFFICSASRAVVADAEQLGEPDVSPPKNVAYWTRRPRSDKLLNLGPQASSRRAAPRIQRKEKRVSSE